MSKLIQDGGRNKVKETVCNKEEVEEEELGSYNNIRGGSIWVPHPNNGIYYPKGHERIMDDVPNAAASFSPTYWFRSIDGVDKSDDPDTSTSPIIFN